MQVSPLTYAAEFEQAATATALLDTYPQWQSYDAVDALYARFGRPGVDLVNEYENDMYDVEQGAPARFVLLH